MGDPTEIIMTGQSKQKVSQIVTEYGRRLFGYIRGKVTSSEDAEDVLQEVWFQLSRALNIGEIEQISGWLFKVARNKIIDKQRKNKPESFADYYDAEEEGVFLKEIFLADSNNPETDYIKESFWQELFAALKELPEKQRQVFVQNELEDLTLQQIADQSGEKLKTIISRKTYAVKHLRIRLTALYQEFLDQ